jgi:hypothetical protein
MANTWHVFDADSPYEPQGNGARSGKSIVDWRKRISDHIAYALLVYTALQIFITLGALRQLGSSLLPYLALVVLVVAVIPACRMMERRWTRLSDAQAVSPDYAPAYRRDRAMVWIVAIGAPFVLTGALQGMSLLF